MPEMPDTPAQKEAREAYDAACRELAAASMTLRQSQTKYDRAHDAYMIALGAAQHAGVLA